MSERPDGWAARNTPEAALRIALERALGPRQPIEFAPSPDAVLAKLTALAAQIDQAPPVPRYIMASHAVPYGRAYRQWTTRGALIVWVNRGELADLPRVQAYGLNVLVSPLAPAGAFGIPVINA